MVLAEAQQFAGFLGLAPVEQRLRVWTRFDTENVEVGTIDGERFAWPLSSIDATPYDTRVMELRLDARQESSRQSKPNPRSNSQTGTEGHPGLRNGPRCLRPETG